MNFLSYIKSQSIGIICILSFFAAFAYNELNLKHLPEKYIRENQTVKTNDDTSYLGPPTKYLNSGKWKNNSSGKQGNFVRTPGYGLLYMAVVKVFGIEKALFYLKLIQYLLFAMSVYWFHGITVSLTKNKVITLATSVIYGLTPFASGFLSYTLTEGITPALVLLYVFLLLKGYQKNISYQKNIFYLFAAFTFSYLLIVRAPLGFLGILLPIFIIKDYWKKSITSTILKLIIVGSVASCMMLIWQYRNYKITNEYIGLHPIYYTDNNSIYRPSFKEFWNFVGGWAQEGHIAHSYMVPMWKAAIQGDTSEVYVKNALKTFPKEVITHFGEKRLTNTFKKYQAATLFQKEYYDQRLPMPDQIPAIEREVVKDFKQLTTEYKRNFWFQYHIISPIKVFRIMAFHSNLSLYMFQKTYRGSTIMETVRILSYGLHSFCFISLIIGIFRINYGDWRKFALAITLFAYVFYLCYFQRGIEERYTLPILPLLLIGLADLYNSSKNALKDKFLTRPMYF